MERVNEFHCENQASTEPEKSSPPITKTFLRCPLLYSKENYQQFAASQTSHFVNQCNNYSPHYRLICLFASTGH